MYRIVYLLHSVLKIIRKRIFWLQINLHKYHQTARKVHEIFCAALILLNFLMYYCIYKLKLNSNKNWLIYCKTDLNRLKKQT